MGKTRIEWATDTWNPVTGCSKVSPGCQNCYAERMAKRLGGRAGYPADNPFAVTLHPERLTEPLHWKKPRRIFPCSVSDIFHPDIPDRYRAAMFGIMAATPRHTYMVLTKRPEAALEWFNSIERRAERSATLFHDDDLEWRRRHVLRAAVVNEGISDLPGMPDPAPWPLPNVWIGVTAEKQEMADKRIPVLLDIPAAVRFVSVEPMLERVDIVKYLGHRTHQCKCGFHDTELHLHLSNGKWFCPECVAVCTDRPGLDWVIGGPETGPKRRKANMAWLDDLQEQCIEAGVPFFLKAVELLGGIIKDNAELEHILERPVRKFPEGQLS